MIEFALVCDECGSIVHASKISPAHCRDEARLMCGAVRVGRIEICHQCAERRASKAKSEKRP